MFDIRYRAYRMLFYTVHAESALHLSLSLARARHATAA